MRDIILYMSMSVDGFVDSDREHPGMAVEARPHQQGRCPTAGCRPGPGQMIEPPITG